jgi:hypothetical protein
MLTVQKKTEIEGTPGYGSEIIYNDCAHLIRYEEKADDGSESLQKRYQNS